MLIEIPEVPCVVLASWEAPGVQTVQLLTDAEAPNFERMTTTQRQVWATRLRAIATALESWDYDKLFNPRLIPIDGPHPERPKFCPSCGDSKKRSSGREFHPSCSDEWHDS